MLLLHMPGKQLQMELPEVHCGAVRFSIFVSDLEGVMECVLMDVVSLHGTKLGCAGDELEGCLLEGWRKEQEE